MTANVDEAIESIDDSIERLSFLRACALDAKTRRALDAALLALERRRQRLARTEELLEAA